MSRAVTVVSTEEFDSRAAELLSEDERAALEFALATNPEAHPVVPGTNGTRKARWGRQGSGKRGGVRVIYFFTITAEAVLLLTVYAKNQKGDLTSEDKQKLGKIVETFKSGFNR